MPQIIRISRVPQPISMKIQKRQLTMFDLKSIYKVAMSTHYIKKSFDCSINTKEDSYRLISVINNIGVTFNRTLSLSEISEKLSIRTITDAMFPKSLTVKVIDKAANRDQIRGISDSNLYETEKEAWGILADYFRR